MVNQQSQSTQTAEEQAIPTRDGWPLIGILPELFQADPYQYLKNVMLKDGDLVKLNIFTKPVYLVSHPDYFQRILRDNYQNYRKPDMFYKIGKSVIGNGLVVSSGPFWLRQRRMIQPHLHRKQLVNLYASMVDATNEILKGWEEIASHNGEIDLGDEMRALIGRILTCAMFGTEILKPEEIVDVSNRVRRIFKFVGETFYMTLMPKWLPVPGLKEFENDIKVTKDMVNEIIIRCRRDKETSAGLIRMLIDSVDEESHEQMTEQQLVDEVMTIVTAGYETTAVTLTWLGVVIEKNPEVLEKLQAEIDQVLGGRTPSFQDIPQLIYTRQVFSEILRMYPPTAFLPRALNEADQLGNYQLPEDALVLIFFYGLHHNPRIWDKPEEFIPERFATEGGPNQHPFAYLPFSSGPRKCAGDEFALLEAIMVIAMVIQKFNIAVVPNQTFTAKLGGSMYPEYGVKVALSLRS